MRTTRNSPAIDLAALSGERSFREMWCKANWIGDVAEMQRDHHTLQKMLRLSLDAATVAGMRPLLDLAVELFKVHALIEQQLLGTQLPAHSIDYALTLVEQLDETDDEDPLYNLRVSNLTQQLTLLMALEEDRYEDLDPTFSSEALDGALLQRRDRLLQDADALIKTHEYAVPADARVA